MNRRDTARNHNQLLPGSWKSISKKLRCKKLTSCVYMGLTQFHLVQCIIIISAINASHVRFLIGWILLVQK